MSERLEAVEGNLIVLNQAVEVLNRLDDRIYAAGGARDGRSPVGAHFRHVFDHYHAFLAGLPQGAIDYDRRRRGTPLEQERRLAVSAALGLIADIGRLPSDLGDRDLRVTLRSVTDRDGEPDWSRSSVKRELQFLVSHTVHHFALIKEALKLEGVEAGAEFGVAPSTLASSRRPAACAQ
ncbi:MAG TPA: hypothetical protein VMG41_14535 [Gemmatimonadales bacterium]|nr:hypothetical protein [Gemmatimonadales bacterium]